MNGWIAVMEESVTLMAGSIDVMAGSVAVKAETVTVSDSIYIINNIYINPQFRSGSLGVKTRDSSLPYNYLYYYIKYNIYYLLKHVNYLNYKYYVLILL